MAEAPTTTRSIFREIGGTGLNLVRNQTVQEEFLTELRGNQGVRVYREMSLSPTAGAILFVIEQMICQVEWMVKPSSEDNEDKQVGDFVQECFDDMNQSWADTLSEICSMFAFGWAWTETVYKMRRGINPGGNLPRSLFDDGKIGWRKWAMRGQDTLYGWDIDDSGGVKAMIQQLMFPSSEQLYIPIEKSLLWRTKVERNNPEGMSILRRAYRPWYYGKRFEEIEAIGVERDLAGLPLLKPPPDVDLWNPRDPLMVSALAAAKATVQQIKRGEKEGVLLPPDWTLELLASGSRRNFDVSAIITREDTRIAQSCLADFIFLGQGKTGSWALSSDKTDMFVLALGGFLKRIKEVVNRYAIPPLLELNGMTVEKFPTLEHGDIETQNLGELAQFLTALASVGAVVFPDEELERHLRKLADFPPPPEGEPRLPPESALMPRDQQQQQVRTNGRQMTNGEVQKKLNELREMIESQRNGKGHDPLDDKTIRGFVGGESGQGYTVGKVYCATGEGGGIDPSCSPGGGGATGSEARARRARTSHVPMTKERWAHASAQEAKIARVVGGMDISDNQPFDVQVGGNLIEVKTIIAGKNPKITMHPESLARKVAYAKRARKKPHTVVIDARGSRSQIYYKSGVGSFRLSNMTKVSLNELAGLLK